mmetsp:Transcript_80096/g.126523  ORF Transcript_80096/g.126523 Transcript_80096/m.126523 type:complete len:92 (+) Transcript_80096:855-1130(+)
MCADWMACLQKRISLRTRQGKFTANEKISKSGGRQLLLQCNCLEEDFRPQLQQSRVSIRTSSQRLAGYVRSSVVASATLEDDVTITLPCRA